MRTHILIQSDTQPFKKGGAVLWISPRKGRLADLMEALIGAVALDVGGFDEAERAFASIVVPPPGVMAAVASGEVLVPGNSVGFKGRPVDTADTPPEATPGAASTSPEFVQPFSF